METFPRTNASPHFRSVTYPDGSKQLSARLFEDIHIRKKLKTEQKGDFMKDVEIFGDLILHGQFIIHNENINDQIQEQIDAQFIKIYELLGYDPDYTNPETAVVVGRWKFSELQKTDTATADYRLQHQMENYYDKETTDIIIQTSSTNAILYYTGLDSTHELILQEGTHLPGRTTAIPIQNHFVIQKNLDNTSHFYIQNSNYSEGKVLTSDANGKATWQVPSNTTSVITDIVTEYGQTTNPSFSVKDYLTGAPLTPNRKLNFIPDRAAADLGLFKKGDYTLQLDDISLPLTITTGSNSGVVRPAGIRMSSGSSGTLELYGGWTFDNINSPQVWARDENLNYLGTYVANTMVFNSSGLHMTHLDNGAINLYGKVHIRNQARYSPSYLYNNQVDEAASLTIGGALEVNGITRTQSLKIPTGATVGYVLTCTQADGSMSWQAMATNVTTIPLTILFNSITTYEIHCQYTFTQNLQIGSDFVKTSHAEPFSALFLDPGFQQITQWYFKSDGTPVATDTGLPDVENEVISNEISLNMYSVTVMATSNAPPPTPAQPLADPPVPEGPNLNTNSNRGIKLEVPITLYDQWRYLNDDNGVNNRARFHYKVYSFVWVVMDWITGETLATVTDVPNSEWNYLPSVFVQLERNYGTQFHPDLPNTASDSQSRKLHNQKFTFNLVPITFYPPQSLTTRQYLIQARVKISYIQHANGNRICNWIRNNGVTTYFPQMFIGGGSKNVSVAISGATPTVTVTHSNVAEPSISQIVLWQVQPYDNNGNFINLSDQSQNDRYSCILFFEGAIETTFRKYQYYYHNFQGDITSGAYHATLDLYTPEGELGGLESMNSKRHQYLSNSLHYNYKTYLTANLAGSYDINMHPNQYPQNELESLQVSLLHSRKLCVADQIQCYGAIYCRGLGGRRGNHVNREMPMINNQWNRLNPNIQQQSIFNFYWTGSNYEIWVDSTRILTGTPNWSDYRLKGNIHDIYFDNDEDDSNEDNSVLFRLKKVPIFLYDLSNPQSKTSTQQHIGCFAHVLQSVFQELPHLVYGAKDAESNGEPTYQHINYNELTMVLFKAIQECSNEQMECTKKLEKNEASILRIKFYLITLSLTTILGLFFLTRCSCS